MATYEPTNVGLKQLKKDLQHGVTLYAAIDAGYATFYRPFTFTGNRLSGYMADGMSAHTVLVRYGPLSDRPPYGAEDIAGSAA